MKFVGNEHNSNVFKAAIDSGLSKVEAAILARRAKFAQAFHKTDDDSELISLITSKSLSNCRHPKYLKSSDRAAARIALAVQSKEIIASVNDYDADGLTSSSVAYKALVDYFGHPSSRLITVVGNRFVDGYGLSDSIVDRILAIESANRPSLVITTDCGSKDEPRIARLKDAGIDVVVTDHHEPPEEGKPPSAYAFVNPNQPGCEYGDKTIAGCGVIWLVMSYVRSHLIQADPEAYNDIPKLSALLDYVALGTVADCVSIASPINRAFIHFGLQIINKETRPCWRVAHKMLGKDGKPLTEVDLAFKLAPRINARSRMCDANAAAIFLRADEYDDSMRCFELMTQDNEDRKVVEADMKSIAFEQVSAKGNNYCSVAYHESFHEGVQGIVASRLVEKFGKPSVVFSPSHSNSKELKGSGRSVGAIALNRVFEWIEDHDTNKEQSIFIKWGGHSGACGCSIRASRFDDFEELLTNAIKALRLSGDLEPKIFVDGPITSVEPEITLDTIERIKSIGPYGQQFPRPIWHEKAIIVEPRLIGNPAVHMKCELIFMNTPTQKYSAVWFNAIDEEGDTLAVKHDDAVDVAFELDVNHFLGKSSVQIMIRGIQSRYTI